MIALNDGDLCKRVEVQLKLLHVARRQQSERSGGSHQSYWVLPFRPIRAVTHVVSGGLRVGRQHQHRVAGAAANCERGSGDAGDKGSAADIHALAPIQLKTQIVGDNVRPERIARFAHAIGDDEAVNLGFFNARIGKRSGHRFSGEIVSAST